MNCFCALFSHQKPIDSNYRTQMQQRINMAKTGRKRLDNFHIVAIYDFNL